MKKAYTKQLGVFGSKVKAARLAKGLTQQELADRIEVDSGTISRIETRKYNPSLALVFAIAQALELDVKALF